jgi:hypothetical protein
MFSLSILFAAAPFALGLIRAVTARDPRMLWMAFAAFVGAALVRMMGKDRDSRSTGVVTPSAVTLVIGTALAGSVAYTLGARAAAGIWPVALILGLCLAASHALHLLSLPRSV